MNQSFDYSPNSNINAENVEMNTRSDNKFTITLNTNNKPNDVFALARAFLSIESMTHKKLQKV